MRRTSIYLTAAILIAMAATPALAINNGTVDDPTNPKYPAVGAIGWHVTGRPNVLMPGGCNGILIAPSVVLSVGHCAYAVKDAFEAGIVDGVWVTFSPLLGGPYPRATWPPPDVEALSVSEIHVHPSFQPKWSETHPIYAGVFSLKIDNDSGDLAVYILAEPYTGAQPMALPEAGLLDTLRQQNGLHNQEFGIAGYGREMVFDPGQGPYLAPWGQDRTYSRSGFRALGPNWLILAMNEETGNGGACFGDSGGPAVLSRCDAQGVCTDVAVGIFSSVDMVCRSLGNWGRLDTPSAREFLGQYVTLP